MEYRTVDSLAVQEPSRNLIDTVDMMADAQEWMIEYVQDNGQEPLSFVARDKKEKAASVIASHIRDTLKLDTVWFENSKNAVESFRILRQRLEDSGIMVMMSGTVGSNTHRKLSVDEFRAFTLVDPYVPLIFINVCDSDNGKLFSLLHETAHIWIGTNSFYNEPYASDHKVSSAEFLCNAVAAELLVPEAVFMAQWDQESIPDLMNRIEELAKYFKCSKYVIIRRALDYQKVSPAKYNEIVHSLQKQYKQWKNSQVQEKGSGGNYYRTLGSKLDHRFVNALAQSAREGKTQYTEVYRLTNTNRKTFSRLVDEIGGAKGMGY